MDGEACLAFLNISRIRFSDSPMYLLNISGPLTAKKFSPLSEAKALARSVLLQPGGPNSKIPLGGLMPRFLNLSGN